MLSGPHTGFAAPRSASRWLGVVDFGCWMHGVGVFGSDSGAARFRFLLPLSCLRLLMLILASGLVCDSPLQWSSLASRAAMQCESKLFLLLSMLSVSRLELAFSSRQNPLLRPQAPNILIFGTCSALDPASERSAPLGSAPASAWAPPRSGPPRAQWSF